MKLLINGDNPIIIGKTNEINYNIMTSWSIMFYNINFYQPLLKRHFEHWTPVLFILINLHIGTNKMCSRNQWGMSIERSIIYYERQLLLLKNNQCRRRCRPKVIPRKVWTFSILVIAKLNLRETVLKQNNAKHNSRENKLVYSSLQNWNEKRTHCSLQNCNETRGTQ